MPLTTPKNSFRKLLIRRILFFIPLSLCAFLLTAVNVNATVAFRLVGIDYPNVTSGPFARGFEHYALDPLGLNFSFLNVIDNATGGSLYKCNDWNFTSRECASGCSEAAEDAELCEINSTWERLRDDLTAGQLYSFNLTPTDPAFSEYAESSGENVTTSTSFINKTVLTFVPENAGKHVIIVTAQLHGNAQSSSVLARVLVDGTIVGDVIWEPKDSAIANDYQAYGHHFVTDLDISNHTIELQWASESGIDTFIKNARITVFEPGDTFNATRESVLSLTTTFQNVINTSVTPSEEDDYLVLASGEYQTETCAQGNEVIAQLVLDGTTIDSSNYRCKDTTDFKPFFFHNVTNLTAGSAHNISIEARRETAGGSIRRARVTAIRLTPDFDVHTAVRFNNCVVLSGKVIFAKTVSTAILSVTLAAISITALTLNLLFAIGRTSKTSGFI